jgi:hypothetical protein
MCSPVPTTTTTSTSTATTTTSTCRRSSSSHRRIRSESAVHQRHLVEWVRALDGGALARSRFTLRDAGDLRAFPAAAGVAERRRATVELPWRSVRQVHGADVVVVNDAADEGDPVAADALVSRRSGVVLSVNVADCAPVAIVSRQHVVAAVHAGWKGLEAGVVEATVAAMRRLGARDLEAWLGPCIHPECYEFGVDDLASLEHRYGCAVRTQTAAGAPALDLPMAVGAALGAAGVALVGSADACTACDAERFFSHRARGDTGRHALVVWIEP